MRVTTIGLDIAKMVFQVHGVDRDGAIVVRKRLPRAQVTRFFEDLPPCLIGIEACATAHHWARELSAFGHDVRLMPAHYVKPYVKRSKNDAADAEAICKAVARPNMRFVPVKAPETQALVLMHRMRTQLVGQRTAMLNGLRVGLAEFGIITTTGQGGANEVLRLAAAGDERMPEIIRNTYAMIADTILTVEVRLANLDREIAANVKVNDACRRLSTIPVSARLHPARSSRWPAMYRDFHQAAILPPGSG